MNRKGFYIRREILKKYILERDFKFRIRLQVGADRRVLNTHKNVFLLPVGCKWSSMVRKVLAGNK